MARARQKNKRSRKDDPNQKHHPIFPYPSQSPEEASGRLQRLIRMRENAYGSFRRHIDKTAAQESRRRDELRKAAKAQA